MKTLILGAGPTGLGAAHVINRLSHTDWQILESTSHVGGLSASFLDDHGFTWDIGGHVLFSHYDYFDQVVEAALIGQFYEHMRESWVCILGDWVPYPFQNNVRYLPEEARDLCVNGLKKLSMDPATAENFKEWMDAIFGEGIVKYFMDPYNRKVWATPPELMSKDWIAERVSVVDLARIERNIAEAKDDIAWGPNNLFKFPKRGGTGAIYNGIAHGFAEKIRLDHNLVSVDLTNKVVTFANGEKHSYEQLISTIPLDQLVSKCIDAPDDMRAAAASLVHNSVYVVGIGLRGKREDTKCWMYFPEDNCPFYRVTNFHNYSPYNVPDGDIESYSALMCETSYSSYKPVAKADIVEETIQGLINSGMISESDRDNIVSRYLIDVPYAYPVPTIGRDAALAVIQPFLEAQAVYSRGRFGAWKYEVGNMDHSFMQGVEVAERLVNGRDETIIHTG
ncbi:MAG: protoporphyrinogen/coproporphyrinogen oxidase [Desulfuromonadales bacterium]